MNSLATLIKLCYPSLYLTAHYMPHISLQFKTVFINFCMKLDLWHKHIRGAYCLLWNPGALIANYYLLKVSIYDF